nr:uncharacterized protein LOC111505996 [Leptinotarsa decemlineata]
MSSSDIYPVWKRIYPVICGKSKNISPATVDEMLKSFKDKAVKGFLEFKPYTKESLEAWKKQEGLKNLTSDEEMCNFMNKLSKELDLDVDVAWILLCNFLMFEYFGKVDELTSIVKYDTKYKFLIEYIWYFYTSDRMFLLKTLRHIFENVHGKNEVYFKVFDNFIKSIDINLLWKNLVQIFENLLGELDREKAELVSEDIVVEWIHRNNREQVEVLLLLMHTLQHRKVDGSELEDLLIIFIRYGFSQHPLYRKSLNISRKKDLLEIRNAEIALVLVIMKSYWNTPGVAKLLPTHIEKDLEVLDRHGDNSIILFAWSVLKTSIGDNEERHMNYCNNVAAKLVEEKVFESIQRVMTHRMFSDCRVGEIVIDAVYTLVLEFTKICADFSYLHEQAGVGKVTAELLKRKGMPAVVSLSPIFQLSLEAFPFVFEPFLEMCKSVLLLPEKYHDIMKLLRSIPGFLSEIPWNDHRRSFNLVGDQRLFSNSDRFIVPSGTVVECFAYQGMEFARIHYSFSFFALMDEFMTSLSSMTFQISTKRQCYENLSELVIIGYKFINHLLKHYRGNLREDKDLKRVVQLINGVPVLFAEGQRKNFEFILLFFEINFTVITRELLDFVEAFPPLVRQTSLPAPITRDRTNAEVFQDLIDNHSLLFKSLREEENMTKHTLLIQYLQFIDFLIEKNIYHQEAQLAGVWYIINCTFNVFHHWNYEDRSEEISISKLCFSIFGQVLQRHLSKVTDNSLMVFEMVLEALLHEEVVTSNYVALFLKDKFHLQCLMEQESNWMGGTCVEYIQSVQLQLVMVLLLFKHRSKRPDIKTTLDKKIGFISKSVTAYILNPYSIPLKKLACRFLEFLARDEDIPLFGYLELDYDQVHRLFLDRLRDSTEDNELKINILDLISTCILHQHGMTAAFFNVKRYRKWYDEVMERTISGDTITDFMVDYLKNIKKTCEYLRSPLQVGVLHIMANLWVSRRKHLIEQVVSLEGFWQLLSEPLYQDINHATCVYTHIFKIFGLQLINDVNESLFLSCVEKFVTNSKQVKSWMEYLLKIFTADTTNLDEIEERKSMLRSWMEFIIMLERTPEVRKFSQETKHEFIMMTIEGIQYFMVNNHCMELWTNFTLLQLSYWGLSYKEKHSLIWRKATAMFEVFTIHYIDHADNVRLTILAIVQLFIENLHKHFEQSTVDLKQLLEYFGIMLEHEYELIKDRYDKECYFDSTARERLLPWTMCVRTVNSLFEFENLQDIALWFSYRNYVQKLFGCTIELFNRSHTVPLSKITLYSMYLYMESPLYLDFLNIDIKKFLITIEVPVTALLYGKDNKLNSKQLEEGWTICTLLFKFVKRMLQSMKTSALPIFYSFVKLYEQVFMHIFLIPETTVGLKGLDLLINTLQLFDEVMSNWQVEWYKKSNDSYNFVLGGVKKIINGCLYTLLRPKSINVFLSDKFYNLVQVEKVPVDLMVSIMNSVLVDITQMYL